MHEWVTALAGWRRYGVAFLLGFLTAASMAPYYILPFLVTGFAGLVWLMDGATAHARARKVAFWTGWWFAWGYFLLSLYWMAFSFMVHATSTLHLAALGAMGFAGVAGLSAFVAVFYGVALAVAAMLWRNGWDRALVLVLVWAVAEYTRGHVLTGLPWNLTGQALAGMAVLSQPVAWIGTYGLGLVIMAAGALTAAVVSRDRQTISLLPVSVLMVTCLAIPVSGFARLALSEVSYVDGVKVQIVQPDIRQQDKIDPDRFVDNFYTHLSLTGENGGAELAEGEQLYVIWPENASYEFFGTDSGALEVLAETMPENGVLISGSIRIDRPGPEEYRFYNSLSIVTDAPLPEPGNEIDRLEQHRGWEVATSYDKHHLAPFGEYIPLAGLIEALGVGRIVPLGAPFTPGSGPETIDLGRTKMSPIICYETIFPGRIYPRNDRPDWLVTVTNDAWFGDSNGPRQHLDMARLRSIESGLPMARAANTGISAMIDPYGRVMSLIPLYERGTINTRLPAAKFSTIYHYTGDFVYFLLLAIIAIWVITSSNVSLRSRYRS